MSSRLFLADNHVFSGSSLAADSNGVTSTHWYDRIINDPVNLLSISLAIIGIVLGIVPLILLIFERKKSHLLDQTVQEFALLDKIRALKIEETKERQFSQQEKEKIEQEARAMQEDVEKRIPNAAMTAYYENTIPQLEFEILNMGERLNVMRQALDKLKGSSSVVNDRVKEILSKGISRNAGARRRLEQLQLFLIVATSVTSAVLSIIPYPFSILATIPASLLTIFVCYQLLIAAQSAYPGESVLSSPIFNSRFFVIGGIALIFSISLLSLAFHFLKRGFYF